MKITFMCTIFLLLCTASIAGEWKDTTAPQQEAADLYGEVPPAPTSQWIEADAQNTIDKSRQTRETYKAENGNRDIASQNLIDAGWTEELTELHKLND